MESKTEGLEPWEATERRKKVDASAATHLMWRAWLLLGSIKVEAADHEEYHCRAFVLVRFNVGLFGSTYILCKLKRLIYN